MTLEDTDELLDELGDSAKNFLVLQRGPLGKAVALKHYGFIAGWLSRAWGVEITPKQVVPWAEHIWENHLNWGLGVWRSDGYLQMVLKNRAAEAGLFKHKSKQPSPIDFFTELHVFFISVEETEEHLHRLRSHRFEEVNEGPTTPAIERSNLAEIHPINRTAAKVVKK
jgi:hypothetical protein